MPARLHFFRECALVLMRARDSGWHAHRAAQVTVSLDGDLWAEREGEALPAREVVAVAPMQRHRLRGDGGRMVSLFFDIGPRAWQHWQASGGRVQAPSPSLVAALRDWAEHAEPAIEVERAETLAARWSAEAWPGLAVASPPVDARLQRALAALDAEPLAPWTHRSLAERAHLSPSRFQVLFRETTGLPVRNYLLWRRLLEATAALQRGASVTEAAHATGFADAAHLSRSFRRIIGAAPSSLSSEAARHPVR